MELTETTAARLADAMEELAYQLTQIDFMSIDEHTKAMQVLTQTIGA